MSTVETLEGQVKREQAEREAEAEAEATARAEREAKAEEDERARRLLREEESKLKGIALPSIVDMSKIILETMQDRKMSGPIFCTLFLNGNAAEVSQKPYRRGKLVFTNRHMALVEGHPKFGDILYTAADKASDEKFLGVISDVRQVGSSFAIVLQNMQQDVVLSLAVLVEGDKHTLAVHMRDFDLGVAPHCSNSNPADVVATFLGHADADSKFRNWILEGVKIANQQDDGITFDVLDGNREDEDEDTVVEEDRKTAYSAWVHVLALYFKSQEDQSFDGPQPKLFKCDFDEKNTEMVDGVCQEVFESAVLAVGQISPFAVYSKNTESFRTDFETVANSRVYASWVYECCAFFIVDEPSYKALQTHEQELRMQLMNNKDQCTGQFLLRIHRNVFECYLMQLNNLWQQADVTMVKIAAIMWLLYYTQLPVFVFHLLQLMAPSKPMLRENVRASVLETVQIFHKQLVKHLDGFLPIRDEQNDKQQAIVDEIHQSLTYLESVVIEQILDNVEQQIPECL